MKTSYTRQQGRGLTYEIDTDRHGNFTISRGGKVLKQFFQPSAAFGKSKWGSKAQEGRAITQAQAAIETLTGMEEE